MNDRKICNKSSNLKNNFKITEAKHIQALSFHDKELFIKLFYHKVKTMLESFTPPIRTRPISALPYSIFDYIWEVSQNTIFSHQYQINKLHEYLTRIHHPTVYPLGPDEIQLYHDLENSIIKVAFHKKNWCENENNNSIETSVIHVIYKKFFENKLHMKNTPVPQICSDQINELEDLYNFPCKYIDILKKEHMPIYGFKI